MVPVGVGKSTVWLWMIMRDNHIPTAGRAEVYRKLTDANLVFTWHEFNAQHAFMRDEGERYDPQLAMTGYQLALQLFGRTLHTA